MSSESTFVRQVAPRIHDDRSEQVLVDASSGVTSCRVAYIRTPPGGGSPEGRHIHAVDQFFFVLEGRLRVVVAEEEFDVGPGGLIVFPAGVPHMSSNIDSETSVHLSFCAPHPPPNEPFATRVPD